MKQLKLTILLTTLMSMVGANAFAHDFAVSNSDGVTIYYTKTSDTEVAVSYRGSSYYEYTGEYTGLVQIPESVTYSGTTYSVTSIGSSAFSYCGNSSVFLAVVIPNSVTSIGYDAFFRSQLVYVDIGTSVKSIGKSAFYNCSVLNSVTIRSSKTSIGAYAFYGCSSLSSVTFHCNSIGSLFSGLTSIKEVIIGDEVTNIGGSAFRGCSGLTSVIIPNSVTSISNSAFYGCSGLTSIDIPNSVTSIGEGAFSGCRGLSSIKVEEGNTTYDSRDNCNAIIETASNKLITGCKNTVVPNSVTSIGSSAFSGCSGLTSVTIPYSVTTIGRYAFRDCSGLTSVTIPNSVTSIGSYAFEGCSGLTSVTIPNSVTSIDDDAFAGCSGLTSVTIPNSVTSIGDYAFSGCSALTSVTIPNSVTTIGDYAFKNCSELTSVTIPNSVTSIGEGAFEGTKWYNNEPDGLVYIGKILYGYKGTMPVNTSVTIKEGTIGIHESAFSGCSGLSSITIPNSVTSIGNDAFEGCKGIEKVIVSDVAAWCEISFGNYFSNPLYFSHHLYNDAETEIMELLIPNSVTSIGSYAFYKCSGLTSVTIPNSVTSIGSSAFDGCSGLTSVTIGNSVTSIGSYAFYKCSGLTSVTIPNSVTGIGSYAFYGCSGLTSIKLPNNMSSIGTSAFGEISSIYANQGTTTLLVCWKAGYTPKEVSSGTLLTKPSLTLESRTQTKLKVKVSPYYKEYTYTTSDGKNFTGDEGVITGLLPYRNYTLNGNVSLGDVVCPITGESAQTLPISPSVSLTRTTASSLSVKGAYLEGDAVIKEQLIVIGDKGFKGNAVTVHGLLPEQQYSAEYILTVAYGEGLESTAEYQAYEDFTTAALTMTTAQPKVVSVGNVVISAETNLDDAEENVGFEWRRTDWTDDFASNTGGAYLYEGTMEGYIRNLYAEKLWKYRPYYQSDSGLRYYGDWVGIDPTNTSYFEPTVHTYAAITVEGTKATVKGYAVTGTDKITSQGFKYWRATASARAEVPGTVDVPADAMTVEAKGQLMTAQLTGLKGGTEYCYVAFATTEEGDTFYGELQTFTTEAEAVTGDATGDGNVTITDAVAVVDFILGNTPADFNAEAADVNHDGQVNITDAVGIVDIILNAKE